MNERIQELRTQAAAWVVANHRPADPKNYTQSEIDQRYLMYEQKFAELIVRECAERLLNDAKLTDIQTTRCVASIREHFGVEQ